jgi:hypothetical protein
LYKDPDIVSVIKAARIRWLGHRMVENSPCKQMIFSQPERCRKRGRPKLKWIDSVSKDINRPTLKVEEL